MPAEIGPRAAIVEKAIAFVNFFRECEDSGKYGPHCIDETCECVEEHYEFYCGNETCMYCILAKSVETYTGVKNVREAGD